MKFIWSGHFNFNAEPELALSSLSKPIQLELIQDEEGGLIGTLKDTEYEALTDATVKVTGFISDNFVSLVAQFPFYKSYDAAGTLSLDTNKLNQEMAFYGQLDEATGVVSGNWEIAENSFLVMDTVHVAYSSGTFELQVLNQ